MKNLRLIPNIRSLQVMVEANVAFDTNLLAHILRFSSSSQLLEKRYWFKAYSSFVRAQLSYDY